MVDLSQHLRRHYSLDWSDYNNADDLLDSSIAQQSTFADSSTPAIYSPFTATATPAVTLSPPIDGAPDNLLSTATPLTPSALSRSGRTLYDNSLQLSSASGASSTNFFTHQPPAHDNFRSSYWDPLEPDVNLARPSYSRHYRSTYLADEFGPNPDLTLPPLASTNMPRTNSSHGLIDLTREDTSPSAPSTSNTSKRPGDPHPESSSSAKRTRLKNGSSPKNSKRIEEVDLVEAEERLAARLEKERAEQVKAQREASKAPRTFSRQTCIICMESYTNVTAAVCGHIFCHECLIQAIAVADRDRSGTGQKGTCPVCRRPLDRKKATNFIPIQLMRKSKYRSRRASASSAHVPPSQNVLATKI